MFIILSLLNFIFVEGVCFGLVLIGLLIIVIDDWFNFFRLLFDV